MNVLGLDLVLGKTITVGCQQRFTNMYDIFVLLFFTVMLLMFLVNKINNINK